MAQTFRLDGFRGEFLWELDIAERQMIAMAEAIPSAKYDWRPDENARSVREGIAHVATGNFMPLDIVGINAPADLYGKVPVQGPERFWGRVQRNNELEKDLREKTAVVDILKRSL